MDWCCAGTSVEPPADKLAFGLSSRQQLAQLSLNSFLLSLSSVHLQRCITLEIYQVDINRK